ncbi:hypothetical protein BX257_4746 [Streptomyces sp. 3212.3]|uniref:hypothetical protein n=1 Tax=Streptomyces sp. 3212.3 TaxID=1938846 RepID=UPI000E3A32C3|nr:hypothetical protein [Streptomyces sp. 3212.3]REE62133.1 hypothetical protein BX257_4746 [Streptomyces sp. 3212.3]
MGFLRVTRWSRLVRARVGYAAGCTGLSVGAGLQFGVGVGLMAAGALTAASCLFLAEVEEKGGDDER